MKNAAPTELEKWSEGLGRYKHGALTKLLELDAERREDGAVDTYIRESVVFAKILGDTVEADVVDFRGAGSPRSTSRRGK